MVAEIMSSVGFDWLTIDLEHSSISVSQAEELIRVITLKGVPTFIVNGKYRVILGADSGISDAKSMADLINYLADK